jgi:hypothetical protein
VCFNIEFALIVCSRVSEGRRIVSKTEFRHRHDVSVGCLKGDFGGKLSYVPLVVHRMKPSERRGQKNLKKKSLTFFNVPN